LDGHTNDLNVSVNVYETETNDDSINYSSSQLKFELENNGTPYESYDKIDCSATTGTIVVDDVKDTGIDCPSGVNPEDVIIKNINIQKWVNVLVTFNNRTLDVYINGKLVKSKPFNNIIVNGNGYNKDIYITPNGGFGGFISKVQYFPYFITPAKAWSIYRGGFGDAFESALNKYNLSVSFYEDQIEKKKFYVF